MRSARLILATLVIASMLTACANSGQPRENPTDARLQRILVGEWEGSMSIGAGHVLSWKTAVQPDGRFSSEDSVLDGSGNVVHFVQTRGTFVVKNGAVLCTIVWSSERNTSLPRTLRPEPIVQLDDQVLAIINENGTKVVSKRALQ